jgi:signal transduction histidine kinase
VDEPAQNLLSSVDVSSDRWMDLRLISSMRVALVLSALLVLVLDPTVPTHLLPFTYVTLILYTAYSVAIFLLSVRRHPFVDGRTFHWFDLLWYLPLIAFSGGTVSMFYFLLFFPIIVASINLGLSAGLRTTLASAALFTIVGLASTPPARFDIRHLLLRLIQLLIFGYMISRWGGHKLNLRNRLQLLKEITVFSHPHFGITRTINSILEKLRHFYDADGCLLLIPGKQNDNYQLYRVVRDTNASGSLPPDVGEEEAALFLLSSVNHAALYDSSKPVTRLIHVSTRQISDVNSATYETLASVLDASSYMSVPVFYRHQPMGRLYVLGGTRTFKELDLDFVLQLMDHVTPLMENMRLVDNLASDAAEQERKRIGRDIHDSVIQPYLGLQFGLSALHQKLDCGNTAILQDVRELLDLTNEELAQLRRYVGGLRTGEERLDPLLPAIGRYVAKFSSVTGIKVDVSANGKIKVDDRLAAELFQIVTEGLSNVRRHAFSSDARIEISCEKNSVLLLIKNSRPHLNGHEIPTKNGNKSFIPRSIAERASLLGGKTEVFVDADNYTVVSVGIPM